MSRPALSMLNDETYDVVIVGAGAVGCAAARELAARGFKTLLLDRHDIAAGTSSRSSRMLYSGLGYLAARYPLWQMPFRPLDMLKRVLYTRDVMNCRAELVADMPGRLTKHRFHYPFRKGDKYPSWMVDLGFRLMDLIGGKHVPLRYRRLSADEAAKEGGLATGLARPLSGVAVFEEYMYAWPERICVDTALDAEARGATIRTYTEVTGIERSGGTWNVALLECAPGASDRATVHARMVVNAAGPWVDRLPGIEPTKVKRVVGVKGVNVMVRLPESYRGQGLEAFSSKGEPFYVFPWRDHHFIGPTETIVTKNPDEARVEEAEVDYILGEANVLFPQLKLTRKHVLHCWCGVRPTSTLDGQTTAMPVRTIEDPASPGLVTLTGSTIMLHRHAGRKIAKAVERRLGKRGQAPQGMLASPADPKTDRDIAQVILKEHVVRLSDLIRRRLPHGLDPDMGYARAEEFSYLMADTLGWTDGRRQEELRHFDADTAAVYRGSRSPVDWLGQATVAESVSDNSG